MFLELRKLIPIQFVGETFGIFFLIHYTSKELLVCKITHLKPWFLVASDITANVKHHQVGELQI